MTRDDIKYANSAVLTELGEKLGVPIEVNYGQSDEWLRAELLAAFDRREGGGPAFGEFKQAGECSIKTGGLTIRDYFAAKCCAAMVSSIQDDIGYSRVARIAHSNGGVNVSEWFASESYKQADAMLRERAK